jgi:hypothetical protein
MQRWIVAAVCAAVFFAAASAVLWSRCSALEKELAGADQAVFEMRTALREIQDSNAQLGVQASNAIAMAEAEMKAAAEARDSAARERVAAAAMKKAAETVMTEKDKELYGADLIAKIRRSGIFVEIENGNSYAWVDVDIAINPGLIYKGYVMHVASLGAGEVFRASLSSFADGSGKRFDLSQYVIKQISVAAKKPNGKHVIELYRVSE